jgi:diaminohydroxyphosphoribosylaminopyrimidine deaminase/5-amino-6-(5-phosphoribosylamino)uracil reductase
LAEAQRAVGRTRPNPNVGCVIAKGDTVHGTGFTAPAGGPHAEIVALKAAGSSARGADVYVTLEPCNHHGRTPPCTDALIEAGVARVFVGMLDPNPLVHGAGIKRLEAAGISVEVGLMADACAEMNRAFAHFIVNHTPYVVAKMAQSLDGRVATRTGASRWITSEASRDYGHVLRDTCDAILVGIGTVLADNPRLTTRRPGGRDPVRVILDTQARTPLDAKVLGLVWQSSAPTWLFVGEGAPRERVLALEAKGARVEVLPERDGKLDLAQVLHRLGSLDIVSLLVEGGPRVLGGFVDGRLVHEVVAFIAPRIIGGDSARSTVAGVGAGELAESLELENVRVERAGIDVVVHARVRR